MWPAGLWMFWDGPWRPAPTGTPSTPDRVLTRARHPSFCSEVAEELVRDLTRRELRQLWDATTAQLGQPQSDSTRFNVVVLRDHLLRRLDEVDPKAVRGYVRGGRPLIRRRRGPRS